ncbi:MAG: DASS family sodium-coupled anion symporter [Thermacetogeniaceae bacterium]|jgi:sodium-dependent dicarboxylate transporter 2/3/5|nr:DASS family sodium-coupled anion symporter [Syntrophomonadaceae bacterium]
MPVESYAVLIILCIAIFLWVTEKLHPAVTGLLIIVLLPLFNVVEFSQAVSGFMNSSIWLLIGVFILSAAMNKTGLDKRIAYSLVIGGKANTKSLVYVSVAAVIILSFIIPSAAGRSALLIPILAGFIRTMSLEKSNLAIVLMLSVTYTSHTIAAALLTSSLSTVYTSSILEKTINYSFGYLEWFIIMFPPSLLMSLLVAPILMKIFPIEKISLQDGMKIVESELLKMGKITKQETKLVVLFCLMFLLWVTNSITHIPLGLSALAVSVLVFMPGIGLIEWREAVQKVDWGSIIIFGSSIGLAFALQETGTINWLASLAFGFTNKLPIELTVTAIYVLFMIIRFGFGSVLGFVTIVIPLAIATATVNNGNPIWLTMVALLGSSLCFFLPSQSPANLPAYSTGFFKTKDMLKAGVAISAMYIIMSTLAANVYWPLVGLTP